MALLPTTAPTQRTTSRSRSPSCRSRTSRTARRRSSPTSRPSTPNITVEASFTESGQLETTLPTQLASGNAPGVFYLLPGEFFTASVLTLARTGSLAELSDQSWFDDIIPAALDGVSLDGAVYGWPVEAKPNTVVYNTALFDKLGLTIPTSYDEPIETCRASAKAGFRCSRCQRRRWRSWAT